MRTIFLIRHAKSSWDHPGLRDFDRPLNDRGRHDAPRMAAKLAATGVKPDLIVSSPAKRALTTALFFAGAFGIPETEVVREERIYEAYPQDILQILSQLPDSAQTVLLFGHNTTLTDVANLFAKKFIDNVPTCGIVRIDSQADSWPDVYEGNSSVVAQFFPKDVLKG